MPRIEKISVYNVGFGDCCLCENEEALMLVDCGAKKNNTFFADTINKLDAKFTSEENKERYMVLTHLHEDHYSGIKSLDSTIKFDKIYLPNYVSKTSLRILGAALIESSSNRIIKQVINILKKPQLFSKRIDPNSKINLLAEEDYFVNRLGKFDVLLPLKSDIYMDIHTENEIERLANIEKQLFANHEEVLSDFAYRYWQIVRYNESENTLTISEDLDQINGLITELMEYNDKQNNTKGSIDIDKIYQRLHNRLSLAFQDKYDDTTKHLLFLGDAEKSRIHKVIKSGRLHESYEFIKVQHHGTKSYFTNKLPVSKYYSISNGLINYNWNIDERYDDIYSSNTNSNIICTNSSNCMKRMKGANCTLRTKADSYCDLNGIITNPVKQITI